MATLENKTIASTYTSLLKLEGDAGSTVAGASGNAVQVKTGDNDVTPLYLNTDRVGIGIAVPTQQLTVAHATTGGQLALNRDDSGVSNNEVIGTISFAADDPSDGTFNIGASIECQAAGTWGDDSTDFGTKIIFSTTLDGTNTLSEKMRISDNGKVGIGIDAPSTALHTFTSGTAATALIENNNASSAAVNVFQTKVHNNNDHADAVLFEALRGTEPIMHVAGNGRVGIGTDAPSSRLEIESPGSGPLSLSLFCMNSSAGDPLIRFGGHAGTAVSADADFTWAIGLDRSANTFDISYEAGGVDDMGTGTVFSIATDGTLTASSSADISDQRLKKNITDLSNPLTTINALRGRTFKWIDSTLPSGTQYGLIAQEVESVLPDLVKESSCKQLNEDGTLFKGDNLEDTMTVDEAEDARNLTNTKTVNMSGVIPVLIEAVKELSAKVTALENA